MSYESQPIGIFDSGMGGISVLREARALLPHEDYLFYGDNAHAPYGTQPEARIRDLACAAADQLVAHGAKALVIACNTATSAAAETLRAQCALPVIAMEPALKPAAACRHGGLILVMATPMTLSLPKFQALMMRYGEGAVPIPCPGLMEFVERGELYSPALLAHLHGLLGDYLRVQVDAVVLGCTHYVFLRKSIASFFPASTYIVDGNMGTVRQLQRVLARQGLLRTEGTGRVMLMTSGDASLLLPRMQRLLEIPKELSL
ncbi:MAG: glutamate racemase [Clostridia bacterium]